MAQYNLGRVVGPQGEPGQIGNGIVNTQLNDDYTLTINYTNGTSDTTESIRGEKGETGADGKDYVITQADYQAIADVVESDITIPTKTSDLINDSGFITNTVNNLINYYLKSETYTKTEVNSLISAIRSVSFEVVNELPTTGESNIIYLVPSESSQTQNVKDEYIWLNNAWEQIGSTAIDLSDYVTITMLNQALADYTTTANLTTLLAGKQNTIDSSNKLSSDLVDDTNSTNKFVTSSEKNTWNAKSDFSGDYNDLTNKPTIPVVPTNVSAFTNDAGYLTQHQDISGKQDIIQYSTIPTATADTIGKIIQYIGTTDSTYTNGYFYIGTSLEEGGVITYSWENLEVQDAGNSRQYFTLVGTSSASLANNLVILQNWYEYYKQTGDYTSLDLKASSSDTTKTILCSMQNSTTNMVLGFINISYNNAVTYNYYRLIATKNSSTNTITRISSIGVVDINELAHSYSGTSSQYTYLSTNNTSSYAPTSDYNPATKKYVDDNIPTDLLHYKGHVASIDNLPSSGQPSGTSISPVYSLSNIYNSNTGTTLTEEQKNAKKQVLKTAMTNKSHLKEYYIGQIKLNDDTDYCYISTDYSEIIKGICRGSYWASNIYTQYIIYVEASAQKPAYIGASSHFVGYTYLDGTGGVSRNITITQPAYIVLCGIESSNSYFVLGKISGSLKYLIPTLTSLHYNNGTSYSTGDAIQTYTFFNTINHNYSDGNGFLTNEGMKFISFNENEFIKFITGSPDSNLKINDLYTTDSNNNIYYYDGISWQHWAIPDVTKQYVDDLVGVIESLLEEV